jgi:hypothetical protein
MEQARHIRKNPFIKHRWLFNMVWWIVMLIFGLLYLYSPIAKKLWYVPEWYVFFFGIFGPLLIVEDFIYLLILNYLYPKRWRGNLIWVFMMPILLLIGYAGGMLFIYSFGISQVK